MADDPDAIVVGSGPNGLAGAVVLAAAGLRVRVYEGAGVPGGGCRTDALTVPGFRHDVCSAVHPLAVASPFFRSFDPASRGVRFLHPAVAYAHPLDGGRAAGVVRSLEATAAGLGPDAGAYRDLLEPAVAASDDIVTAVLSSMRVVPRRPDRVAGFGVEAIRPASSVIGRFRTDQARALLAGVAAHAMLRLDQPMTAGVGMLLGTLAHSVGWPVVAGGSDALASAMLDAVEASGGEVVTGRWVRSLEELPPAPVILADVAPRGLLGLAGDRLPPRYRRALQRFRHGPGVCKVDWALSGPVPWAAEVCRVAGTLHLGGTAEEIARAEADVAAGRHPEAPYVLVVQPGVVDPTRAPAGHHTLWTYCHVPPGSEADMAGRIAAQVERFAPGFGDLVLARTTTSAAAGEEANPNLVGGDIGGGAQDLRQTALRPVARWNPYRTPVPGLYLCSSSTPPGPGVHGRCGELAARVALRDVFGIREAPDLALHPSWGWAGVGGSPRGGSPLR